MKKILVVGEKFFFRLYDKGVEFYAQEKNVKVDFFEVEALKTDNIFKKLAFKYGVTKAAYYEKLRDKLISAARSYDQILFINLFYDKEFVVNEKVLDSLKDKDLRLYFVDTMKILAENYKCFRYFSKVGTFELQDIEFAKTIYNLDVEYIPTGTSYCAFNLSKNSDKVYDVCFAGNKTPKRVEYLDAVAEFCEKNNYRLCVIGHYWHNTNLYSRIVSKNKFKCKHPTLIKYITSTYMPPIELARIYQKSRICLNINVEHHKGINQRLYDVLACRSLMITDDLDASGTEIVDGKDFIMAHGKNDMLDKILYYLDDSSERERIVNNGYNVVLKQYTIVRTLERMLET